MATLNDSWDEQCDNAGSLEPRISVTSSTHEERRLKETQVVHAQNKQKRVHRRRDCAGRENHIKSQFGSGIAALTVLRSFQVLQVTPYIVGLKTNTVFSSFCTTLTTSGKLFDTTSLTMHDE